MSISIAIFIFLIFLIFVRSILNLIELVSNIHWLRKNKIMNVIGSASENFIICIPMLREQKILPDTIKYFSNFDYPKDKYKVIIVTTSKETKENDKITTFDLASGFIQKVNKKLGIKLFQIINYPKTKGMMSHQINYVIRRVSKSARNKQSIFAVYNADSRPNFNTLKFVSFWLNKYEREIGRQINIIQQSSIFTSNYNKIPRSIEGSIMRAAALFQTKWTLIHELSRFRKQSKTADCKKNNIFSSLLNTQLSHCVGHGLFVRLSLLSKEYLPTETINEDLPFGFYQCCKREPILPFPILENSEVPQSFKYLINQKRVWFYPYLEYKKCRDRVIMLKRYKSLFEVYWLTFQGHVTGLIWFFQSLVLFLPIIIAIFLNLKTLVWIWALAIISYWFLPIGIIYLNLNFLEKLSGEIKTKISIYDYLITSVAGIFILLTHSLGPAESIYDFAVKKFFNKPIIKAKTER